MCGVFGVVDFAVAPDEAVLEDRTRRLRHRGPDNMGLWSSGVVSLGHTRLSILDPAPAANQPFGDDRYRLVFNGEIYNYKELARTHLTGVEFNTSSDTEVLFEVLKRLGADALPLLNGMFALAFLDLSEDSLLLARDVSGIKPLHYVRDAARFEFSSEIKSLSCTTELDALKEVLARGHFEAGYGPYSGVEELEPGHFARLHLGTRSFTLEAYSTLPARVDKARFEEMASRTDLVDILDKLLQESVALHLQSDVPLGSLCSGGLDSSLISAIAVQQDRNVSLYHAGIEGGGGEERYSRTVARRLGIPLVCSRMSRDEYWRIFPLVTWHSDLPIYHPNDVSLFAISERAAADGVKVLLAGEGADELFGGYPWHQYLREQVRRHRVRDLLGRGAARAGRLLSRWSPIQMASQGMDAARFTRFAGLGPVYSPEFYEAFFKGHALASQDFGLWTRWGRMLEAYAGVAGAEDAPVLALMLDNLHGHLRTILHRTDRILMAHSIEGRVPFLENGLFDFALNLPLEQKIRGREGKYLLKKVAERYLPREIVYRKKAGFPVPWQSYLPDAPELLRDGFVSDWTGVPFRGLCDWCAGDPGLTFRLIAIEVWGRIFERGEAPSSIQVA